MSELLGRETRGRCCARDSKPGAEDAVTPEEEIKDPYILEFLGLKDEDLVSFHRRLRCLVIINLKSGSFTHADSGQMHLYLNYARENWMRPGENPPVGLILCAKRNEVLAHYALDGLPNKVMIAEYRTTLPEERRIVEELMKRRKKDKPGA